MNIALHDTYYVISHFHIILSMGIISSLLSFITILLEHILSTITSLRPIHNETLHVNR